MLGHSNTVSYSDQLLLTIHNKNVILNETPLFGPCSFVPHAWDFAFYNTNSLVLYFLQTVKLCTHESSCVPTKISNEPVFQCNAQSNTGAKVFC